MRYNLDVTFIISNNIAACIHSHTYIHTSSFMYVKIYIYAKDKYAHNNPVYTNTLISKCIQPTHTFVVYKWIGVQTFEYLANN